MEAHTSPKTAETAKTGSQLGFTQVTSDICKKPDKDFDEAESILAEAGMIYDASEDEDQDTIKLFKEVMFQRYEPVVRRLFATDPSSVRELHGRLISELKRLEYLEYTPRYFKLLIQAGIVDDIVR